MFLIMGLFFLLAIFSVRAVFELVLLVSITLWDWMISFYDRFGLEGLVWLLIVMAGLSDGIQTLPGLLMLFVFYVLIRRMVLWLVG